MGLVLLIDLILSVLAVLASFYLRFEGFGLQQREHLLFSILPFFAGYAAIVFLIIKPYRTQWRFTSLFDLTVIARAATVLALSLLILDYFLVAPNVYGGFFFGKLTILLYWLLEICFLGAPRFVYRYLRQMSAGRDRAITKGAAIVLGRPAEADVLLRAIENGTVDTIRVVGILSPLREDVGRSIRGIEVVGALEELEGAVEDFAARGVRVARLVLTSSALQPEAKPEAVLGKARRLGLATSRLPLLDDGTHARMAPVAVEDLLLRPSVNIEYKRIESTIRGKSIVVTGGGGSIGAELCRRVVDFGAARLMIVENSEPFLHAIVEELAPRHGGCRIEAHVADIRDRERITSLFSGFRPDIVFHAAALKHVPILEQDWSEGVKTNVFGSINVADAAVTTGARALVMISTDKAVEPVSVLGVTKRLAEMYCQSVDAHLRAAPGGNGAPTRLIAVRFGNVLASNGSVVPKFQAQNEAGGPVTVTDPEAVRYFMTIREACDLVITAASHALADGPPDVSVYILNMGQPVKISALAERMIRLSGLEPGIDIDIVYTGMRPGERLNEILFSAQEPVVDIGIPGIVGTTPVFPDMAERRRKIIALENGVTRDERDAIFTP
jgi:O-antigen biosynthesis protein WbqV